LGYSVLSAVEILKNINLVFLVLEGFMACVGAIGLVVSLFGIANTMAMAVLERTREIGIMKALGARNRDIGRLFLSEAAAIGALGGVVGLAAGTALGKLLNLIAHLAFDLPERVALFHVTVALAGGSVLFSILVSVAAGWLPSRRAARMEPVAAVRYE
jgi:ABC-type antimicrobial peptide transport system permease subunit